MTFPTATASPAALLMRLQRARHLQDRYRSELNNEGHRLVCRAVSAMWDDCIQAGLAGPARVVMGIGEGT